MDLLRLIALTFLLGPHDDLARPSAGALPSELLRVFREAADDEGNRPIAWESARLLAFLDVPEAVDTILKAQEAADGEHATQIHFAYCLRAMKNGWNPKNRRQLWAWYEKASRWDGGFSFLGYLDFMVQELVARLTPEERGRYLADGAVFPFPTRVLVRRLDPDAEPDRIGELTRLSAQLEKATNTGAANELRALILEKLGQSAQPEAKAALRRLAKSDPDRLGLIARNLAARPTAADLPVLVAALDSRDPNTLGAVLNALGKIEAKPEGPEGLRNLIRMARRLGPPVLPALNGLASRWTGMPAPGREVGFDRALKLWEDLYAERYPTGPPLADAGALAEHHYTLPQLVDDVVKSGRWKDGSPERGQAVLKRAKCLDCHKFGDAGAGLGPDLTTVSSRFRPEEVLESIVEPSKVISDQYKSVTIATADGQILNGMPAGGDAKTLVLLLSDGTKVNIPKDDIEAQKASDVSVMPAGLADTLSVQEMADLLALFEAQPKVSE